MALKTFEDLRIESIPHFEKLIKELETTLRYTKKTVRCNILKKEILYWTAQVDMVNSKSLTHQFFERYPKWMPKNW